MATKRKTVRRAAPRGLAEIPALVINRWRVYGPEVDGDPAAEWRHPSEASWQDWAAVYETCREEMLAQDAERRASQMKHPALARQLASSPPKVLACERIYQAMLRGDCPDEAQAAIRDEMRANDPRCAPWSFSQSLPEAGPAKRRQTK